MLVVQVRVVVNRQAVMHNVFCPCILGMMAKAADSLQLNCSQETVC